MALSQVEKNKRSRHKNNIVAVGFHLKREEGELLALLEEGETAPQLAKKLFFNEMEKRKNEN